MASLLILCVAALYCATVVHSSLGDSQYQPKHSNQNEDNAAENEARVFGQPIYPPYQGPSGYAYPPNSHMSYGPTHPSVSYGPDGRYMPQPPSQYGNPTSGSPIYVSDGAPGTVSGHQSYGHLTKDASQGGYSMGNGGIEQDARFEQLMSKPLRDEITNMIKRAIEERLSPLEKRINEFLETTTNQKNKSGEQKPNKKKNLKEDLINIGKDIFDEYAQPMANQWKSELRNMTSDKLKKNVDKKLKVASKSIASGFDSVNRKLENIKEAEHDAPKSNNTFKRVYGTTKRSLTSGLLKGSKYAEQLARKGTKKEPTTAKQGDLSSKVGE